VLPDVTAGSIALYFAVFLVAVGYSIWKGGEPERGGGVVMLYTFAFQASHYFVTQPSFLVVDPASLLVDTIILLGFGSIAMAASRKWPLVASALALLSLGVGHFGRFVAPEVFSYAYVISGTIPTMVILVLLVVGTRRHQVRLKKFGVDPDWVDFKYWADLKRHPNMPAEFFRDLRESRARGWLEEPTIAVGAVVLVYTAALSIATLVGLWGMKFNLLGVALMLALGSAALIGGLIPKRIWYGVCD